MLLFGVVQSNSPPASSNSRFAAYEVASVSPASSILPYCALLLYIVSTIAILSDNYVCPQRGQCI